MHASIGSLPDGSPTPLTGTTVVPMSDFVLGIDLDGVCADFYGRMREITAEWKGVPVDDLPQDVSYGLPEWNLYPNEYERIHRFAVTQRDLFKNVDPIPGAPQAIRRLGTEGIRIRIITHRLFIRHFHEVAVAQTVRWLDAHGIPYWDLCFMRDKQLVDADIYVEDTDKNIRALEAKGYPVIAFTNSTNAHMDPPPALRADNWEEAEGIIRSAYYEWLEEHDRPRPAAPGHAADPLARAVADGVLTQEQLDLLRPYLPS